MDVSTLTRPTEYAPKFNDNRDDEEPFKVLLKPLTREHYIQWVELLAELAEGASAEDAPLKEKAKAIRSSTKTREVFVRTIIKEYVAGSKDLKADGKEVKRKALFDLIERYPALEEEVFTAIVKGGTLTEADAKNSE